jgi:Protein of unknown function (DUF4232)
MSWSARRTATPAHRATDPPYFAADHSDHSDQSDHREHSDRDWDRQAGRRAYHTGRYGRFAWQLIAVAAFAGTATLAIVVARPGPASPVAAVTDSACAASGLRAVVGRVSMPTLDIPGTVNYAVEFTNVSSRTCVMDGYPGVEAFGGARTIGSPATLDTSVRPMAVTLAPGATAHAMLRYTGAGWFGAAACRLVAAPDLRIYPPDQAKAMVVHWRSQACSQVGFHFLSVQAVQPRAVKGGLFRD